MLRATTADDTSTAWSANVPKELAIAAVGGSAKTTYTVAAATAGDQTAQLYLACMVKATVPSLVCQPMTAGVSILTPACGITTATSLSTPQLTDGTVTYTFGAAATAWPYAYVIGA